MTSPCSATPPPGFSDPLRLDPAWQSETVLALARGIATDNGFDRLPILADALKEAGCDNRPMLDHLRHGEPHCVECWALRALLRTTLLLPSGVPITFAYCPPGSFLMGSEHPEAGEDERPVHRVTLTRGLYAGVCPVTQAQWRAVMGNFPSEVADSDEPVVQVSWRDTQLFCWRSSAATAVNLRLPTEAEWEYVCRAGTTTEFWMGEVITDRAVSYNSRLRPSDDIELCFNEEDIPEDSSGYWAHYASNGSPDGVARDWPTASGLFSANHWGLFDCHGNVWEWCQDWYNEKYYRISPIVDPTGPITGHGYRVRRGGSFSDSSHACRSSSRGSQEPGERIHDVGFRVVFTV